MSNLGVSNVANNIKKPRFKDGLINEVQKNIGNTINNIDSTLKKYEGFTKISIMIDGNEKEIWVENKRLKVDSSEWEEKNIGSEKVKINKQGDIIEFLEGNNVGEQLFTLEAAIREAEKQGKRLPKNFNEFSIIIKKIGIQKFIKKYPGFYSDSFIAKERGAYYWIVEDNGSTACTKFKKYKSKAELINFPKEYCLSVLCIKD